MGSAQDPRYSLFSEEAPEIRMRRARISGHWARIPGTALDAAAASRPTGSAQDSAFAQVLWAREGASYAAPEGNEQEAMEVAAEMLGEAKVDEAGADQAQPDWSELTEEQERARGLWGGRAPPTEQEEEDNLCTLV